MINNFIVEAFPLLALCALIVVVSFALAFWSRHYSQNAKALNNRLVDIVTNRSSFSDDQFLKNSDIVESRILPGAKLDIILVCNEAIKLMLLRADLTMTPLKFITLSFVLYGSTFLLLHMITPLSFLILILISCFFGALPFLYVKRLELKRSLKIEKQLPEALDFICRSLRAGHGLSVSFGIVGDELPQPIAKEFKTVFEEINFGLPFNEAMANFAVRTNSNDINFLVVGLLIQREAGGNLIELLENLSKTIRDRMILKGKVRVLSSEGKYSGILLSLLPFILAGILSFMNPNYMSLLWTSDTGQSLVIGSIVMIFIGGCWMWNISRIEV